MENLNLVAKPYDERGMSTLRSAITSHLHKRLAVGLEVPQPIIAKSPFFLFICMENYDKYISWIALYNLRWFIVVKYHEAVIFIYHSPIDELWIWVSTCNLSCKEKCRARTAI